jgi:threonine dehydrogenase-like Zn-dependent dehydrogenase
MKALKISGVEKAEIIEVPELQRPSPGEARVKIMSLGLCGSDIAAYLGRSPLFIYPNVIGHEFSGVVEEINDTESPIKEGDRVTANPLFSCGKCIACRRGYYNCCTTLELMGVHTGGAAQSYINIPVSNLFRLPDSISYRQAAMIEPMTIGYNAVVNRGNVQPDDFVVVLGCGTIGLSAIQACKANGATVLGVDVKENNLKWARSFGADYIVNSDKEDLEARVKEYSGNDLATLVVEAVGLPELLRK